MKQFPIGEWYNLPLNVADCNYIDIEGIDISVMPREEFLKYPQWITQRSVEGRIKKKNVLDHLQSLFPTHYIVGMGMLTNDDIWEDETECQAGQVWTIDANSRAYLWKNNKVDILPDNVLAVRFRGKTLKSLRSVYWAYDNPTAAEMAAEIVTGALKSLNTKLKTKKFQDGQFVTALSYTTIFDNPTTYGKKGLWTDTTDDSITNSEFKRTMTCVAVQQYLPTIKAVDALLHECGMSKDFDQTFMTSLFLFHRKYGIFDDNVKTVIKLLAETLLDEDGEKIGIATTKTGALEPQGWIKRENEKGYDQVSQVKIPDRGKIDGFYQGVPFFCYWLSQAYENGTTKKQKTGPRSGYKQWFDDSFLTIVPHSDLVQRLEETVTV